MTLQAIKLILPVIALVGCALVPPVQRVDRGNFGPFDRSLNTRSYGYQLVDDPLGEFDDQLVERFEVRPGDCVSTPGWSDCKNDRERSEVKELVNRKSTGVTAWYGWNFYLHPDWPNVFPTKTALGQFHDKIGPNATWMFLQKRGGLYLDDHSLGYSSRMSLLIPEEELVGKWHRIEMHIKWAENETGFIEVWANNRLMFEHQGKTMNSDTVYFKYGVYRSFMKRYKNTYDVDSVPTQIAYFGNVSKAQDRAGLR